MKATGIVRRIDELGRIVVPKEIRRVLRIREGDPLEIFTDKDGEIVLKKYSPIGELSAFAQEYVDAIAASLGCGVCVCDRDQIIAVAGISRRICSANPCTGNWRMRSMTGKRFWRGKVKRSLSGFSGTEIMSMMERSCRRLSARAMLLAR